MEHELIEAAAKAVIGALTKAAAEPALAAGGKVWGWLKGRLGGDEAKTAEAIEAAPAKASAAAKVTALLQDAVEGDPAALDALRRLLAVPGGVQAITQSANVSGDGNKTAQVAGNKNTVQIG